MNKNKAILSVIIFCFGVLGLLFSYGDVRDIGYSAKFVFFFGGWLLFLGTFYPSLSLYLRRNLFKKIRAEVANCKLYPSEVGDDLLVCEISYEVGGSKYKEKMTLGTSQFKGVNTEIYYNPKNPKEIRAEFPAKGPLSNYWLLVLLLLSFASLILFFTTL